MNKNFWIGTVVIFILWMAGSFVIHGVLLHGDYAALPNLMRPEAEAQQYMHFMLLAHLLMAGAFTWIYARGVESKAWLGQGLRFGFAVALLAVIPLYTIYYVVQPTPGMLAVKQIGYCTLKVLILGAVVAYMYRGQART